MRDFILIVNFIVLTVISYPLYGQVTIGKNVPPDPSAMLDLKPLNKDKGFLGPMIELKSKTDQETIKNPVKGLLVFNTLDSGSGQDRVYKDKFYYWTGQEWEELVGQDKLELTLEEAFNTIAVPRPAIFYLNGQDNITNHGLGMSDPLYIGFNQSINLPLRDSINHSAGMVKLREGSDNILVFQPGVYKIVFSYTFIPIGSGPVSSCQISSYYMEFPIYSKTGANQELIRSTRVYSNTYHGTLTKAAHSGSINFVSCIKDPTEWEVKLGVGSAGNCNNIRRLSLPNRNTTLYIMRIGEWKDN